MRWWIVLLLASCSTKNWEGGSSLEEDGAWAALTLPANLGDVERQEPDLLVVDYPDKGSAQRQRVYKDWNKTLQNAGWKPVETYGNLSTGSVMRANYHGVGDGKHGLLEVTRRGEILRVSVRKTTVKRGWDPA